MLSSLGKFTQGYNREQNGSEELPTIRPSIVPRPIAIAGGKYTRGSMFRPTIILNMGIMGRLDQNRLVQNMCERGPACTIGVHRARCAHNTAVTHWAPSSPPATNFLLAA